MMIGAAICILAVFISIFSGGYITVTPIQERSTSGDEGTAQENSRTLYDQDNGKLRGSIIDRNGAVLSYTVYDTVTQDCKRHYCDTADTRPYALAMASLIDGFAGSEGMNSVLESVLRHKNATETTDNAIGQSVRLTVDSALSAGIYSRLQDNSGAVLNASVVVMKPDGGLLAMVSSPGLDLNDYIRDARVRVQYIADSSLINQNRSVFLIGTEPFEAAAEVFLGGSADALGYNKVSRLLTEKFAFNSGLTAPDTFGRLDSNQITSHGGKTEIRVSTDYLAAYMNACVLGNMMQPYLLDAVVDTNHYESVIEDASLHDAVAVLSAEQCRQLRAHIAGFADTLGYTVPDGFALYGGCCRTADTDYFSGVLYNESTPAASRIAVLRLDNSAFAAAHDLQEAAVYYCAVLDEAAAVA